MTAILVLPERPFFASCAQFERIASRVYDEHTLCAWIPILPNDSLVCGGRPA